MGIHCPSFSKVNIGLKVLNQRDDGYHDIYTVFQELDFGDIVTVEKTDSGCTISSNADWVPTDEANICHKAYEAIRTKYPELGGVSIHIQKNVPVGSGLGGGSANGAAVLKGINNIYNLGLSNDKLEKIGAAIGADVPFFIRGKTQLGEGIGDKLTSLADHIEGTYLLVIPDVSISTPWAYSKLKNKLNPENNLPNFAGFIGGDYASLEIFENDFERIVIPAYPKIGAIKQKLLELGARFASLSGSGSTVYGIFNEDASAKEAELFFRPSHQTILANPT
ncbi:MAG: 4-(cytidine 5'-diphospho)-2-C-methyl-D-erythritol kinase [Candidatus Marinimicrobia bacterium]|jgi:4-diphosphocytidyl-2-C-methyl-D-erythritol kinase|nr:4-(cytidine 5'-diphospho)-2-C-methyl-D-erythritol kinase [Candidatus Neomarinimicrobiota bacterium]MBT4372759.1 4-(cytidine 5'-diphospho)-2-C-methyl-D-erythritol kinase [Candidatus Neomarinimicrobiota bacterium]MBT4808380.1 4-(cytidine 5'-diphospho)-2-C-methyl-D-erythritol kinase [Candidatus Neomarinimicrobiota bacterium]MBT6636525.1 4-(cytidine 5'-diphospho)-2-C-methyl-D-erythritol kinase [Candidatus Neomarinimicrobiota bacterium]MBT7195015.1 4-(cytidine 5'-diphospho)-2-C-methyl-D-erythrito